MKIKDIAQKAGVSLATVSRVINGSGYVKKETKDLVLKTMEELNYPLNTYHHRSRSNIIGVVIPDIANPFFSEVLKGINKVADDEKLNIILCNTDENIEKEISYLEMLKGHNIKGLIITPTTDQNEFNRKYLDRDIQFSHYDAVFLDSIKGAYEGVEALIKEGHRKVAIISGPTSSKPGRDRFNGYKKALYMNNIDEDEKYIFFGDFKLESGYNITKKILKMSDPPTAVFVSNNMMTMGCIKALTEEKVNIPQDIAVVGFDDIEAFNLMNLNISTVSRPTSQMGEAAMQILMERLNGKGGNGSIKEVILSPSLTLRGSEKLISNS